MPAAMNSYFRWQFFFLAEQTPGLSCTLDSVIDKITISENTLIAFLELPCFAMPFDSHRGCGPFHPHQLRPTALIYSFF